MKNTKIVCTIGPSANNLKILKQMINEGMNVARFNMSHGNHNNHLEMINLAKQASQETKSPLAIMIDTKGPEIRVGEFANGSIELKKNQKFILTTTNVIGNEERATVSYKNLPLEVKSGTQILIDDGNIELSVLQVVGADIVTKVIVGGKLSNRKSINIPNLSIKMPYISQQDKADIAFACDVDADYLALSFVRNKQDVLAVKKLLATYGKPNMKIISKIENQEGVNNAHEILQESDGIMVARGDLGVEVDFAEIPLIQKYLISECNEHGKISITATQMMESMSQSNRPTRAEISDVANAICDGTTAIMLSAETSAGKHPALCVQTMSKIASNMDLSRSGDDFAHIRPENMSLAGNIGYGVCALEYAFDEAIIVCLNDVNVAKSISNFRPNAQVIFFTDNSKEYRESALYFGVESVLVSAVDYSACLDYVRKHFKRKIPIIMVSGSSIKVENV